MEEADAPPGAGLVWVTVDNEVSGAFVVSDTIREDARGAVSDLKELGIEAVMLTGDAQSTAEHVARQIGIERVIAGVLPDQKGETLRGIQEDGKSVAMVGDGVNDAPALAMADVSLAMSTGTDVAMSTADITILGDELMRIPNAIRLSKRTMRIIRENLFWAFNLQRHWNTARRIRSAQSNDRRCCNGIQFGERGDELPPPEAVGYTSASGSRNSSGGALFRLRYPFFSYLAC